MMLLLLLLLHVPKTNMMVAGCGLLPRQRSKNNRMRRYHHSVDGIVGAVCAPFDRWCQGCLSK